MSGHMDQMVEPEKHCISQDLALARNETEQGCSGGTIDGQYKNDGRDYSAPPASNAADEKSLRGVGHHNEGKLSPEDARRKVNELRLRSSTIEQLGRDETELRIKMYFHISNPLNRWKKYRYVTWKFLLQLTKTFCIAAQVCVYHGGRDMYISISPCSYVLVCTVLSSQIDNPPPPPSPPTFNTF